MKNPKSEIRNPKQNFKQVLNFENLNLDIVSNFVLRASKFFKRFSPQKGQLLVEAVLAIALLGILAGIIGMAVNVSTQSNKASGKKTVATALAQEAIEAVRAIKDNNETTGRGWNKIFIPSDGKGAAKHYYPQIVSNKWQLTFGEETVQKDGVNYTRYLYIDNVCRDARNGGGDIAATGSCNLTTNWDDPSTQYVRITMTASGIPDVVVDEYLTRAKNEVKVWDTDTEFKASGSACSNTKVLNGPGAGADVELSAIGGGC